MNMVSYAQNFEDVRLRRVFNDAAEGFYIDVGAWHPTNNSVTKHFYDRGWRGMNIEPTQSGFHAFCKDRPRDINLNLGVSNHEGTLIFFEEHPSLGRSTFSARKRDEARAEAGYQFAERAVPVATLAALCERYADQPIDFLKIDVEGHEPEVLEGADLTRWRPRVLLIEGGPDAWEKLLQSVGYLLATFDGVNEFYVRSEDRDLIPALAAQISILDDFVPHYFAAARSRLDELEDLGPVAIGLARWAKRVVKRIPYAESLIKGAARVA
jgi:FkbM family methyltransferase